MGLAPVPVNVNKKINLVDQKHYTVPENESRFELTEGQDTVAFILPEQVPVGKIAVVDVEVRVRWKDAK